MVTCSLCGISYSPKEIEKPPYICIQCINLRSISWGPQQAEFKDLTSPHTEAEIQAKAYGLILEIWPFSRMEWPGKVKVGKNIRLDIAVYSTYSQLLCIVEVKRNRMLIDSEQLAYYRSVTNAPVISICSMREADDVVRRVKEAMRLGPHHAR